MKRRYLIRTAFKSQKTITIKQTRQLRITQYMNRKIASKFDFNNIFASVSPEDVLRIDEDGVIQLNPNNPKHKEIRARLLED
ncbi:hypothetical protein ACVBAX_10360 [Robertmurraya sp. GLU-23]